MSQIAPDPVQDLFAFLRFASISTDAQFAKPTHDCAEWLKAKLTAAGLSAEVHPTPGHPIVLARNQLKPGRRTVMIYGHYDVQPVDPVELWSSPPFEPVLKDGIITARGSTDNKGQILAHILGVAETTTGFYLSTGYKDVPGLVLLLIVLAVRPAGLFGKTAIKKV